MLCRFETHRLNLISDGFAFNKCLESWRDKSLEKKDVAEDQRRAWRHAKLDESKKHQ